ncbi:MAG: hypothetical protein HN370_10395 [Phycisphaerales bacterium]|nr:hypothetical protein [Phycisphaerales bacterium]
MIALLYGCGVERFEISSYKFVTRQTTASLRIFLYFTYSGDWQEAGGVAARLCLFFSLFLFAL